MAVDLVGAMPDNWVGYEIAGTGPVWNDGSDATWISNRSFQNSAGGNSNWNSGLMLQQAPSVLPSIDVTARASISENQGLGAMNLWFQFAWSSGNLYGYWGAIPSDGGIYNRTVTVSDPALMAALAAESVEFDVMFRPDVDGYPMAPSGYDYIATVYELAVGVPGGVTTAPPLRQHPRTDGRGTSSARRVWPPPRSIQGSIRRVGGYL